MGDQGSVRGYRMPRGLVLAVLCLLPGPAFVSSSYSQKSGQTSGKHDPYFVCDQGQRQSPINIVPSENEGSH
jgi:carbonic anhydrase